MKYSHCMCKMAILILEFSKKKLFLPTWKKPKTMKEKSVWNYMLTPEFWERKKHSWKTTTNKQTRDIFVARDPKIKDTDHFLGDEAMKVCARAPLAQRPMTSPEQSGLCLSGEWEFQCVDETLRGTFSSTQLGVVRRTKLLSSGTNCWIFFWWKQLKYRPMRLFSHQWGKL